MKVRKGFTLIELLVVIAIIALLLSIITPALRRAKEAAWNVMCRNGLKHYGLAGIMYTDEYDTLFPNAWGSVFRSVSTVSTIPRGCQWHVSAVSPMKAPQYAGSLWPYLGSQEKSHLCPVFDRFARNFHECPAGSNNPMEPIFGYSMNAYLGGMELQGTGQNQYNHVLKVKRTGVRSPTAIFFFGEENPWINADRYTATLNDNALCGGPDHPNNVAAWTTNPAQVKPFGSLKYWDCLATFHKTTLDRKDEGLANVVFIDGHVDLVHWSDTYRFARWTNTKPF